MQSNLNLYSLGRFFLALGLAFCLIMAGSVGPTNEALADGGGPDTAIIKDTSLGRGHTGDSVDDEGGLESVPGTTEESLTEWALKQLFSYWIP